MIYVGVENDTNNYGLPFKLPFGLTYEHGVNANHSLIPCYEAQKMI